MLLKPLIGTTLLLAASVVGVTGYRVAGWSWLDSIYMVVITIFSVGYGEVQATTPELKVFTIGLIFSGCSAYVYIVGAFINWLTEGQLQRILGKRKMAHEIKALDRHSIICGYGLHRSHAGVGIERCKEAVRSLLW
jgi:voltage-gated potassium channel